MAEFNGTDFTVSIAGTPNKKIGRTRDISFSLSASTIDVSSRDSLGWREVIGGQRSWTMSVSGITDYIEGANEATTKTLTTTLIARTAINFIMGNTTLTGSQTYAGSGVITSFETSAPYEGEVEWTMEIEGSGPITLAVVA